jgi:hypothetical protein
VFNAFDFSNTYAEYVTRCGVQECTYNTLQSNFDVLLKVTSLASPLFSVCIVAASIIYSITLARNPHHWEYDVSAHDYRKQMDHVRDNMELVLKRLHDMDGLGAETKEQATDVAADPEPDGFTSVAMA